MSVVKELDLVSTETIKMLVFGLKASLPKSSCPPESESIVDKSDHRPDDEQGDGDREGGWVEAVHHRAPQDIKLRQTFEPLS